MTKMGEILRKKEAEYGTEIFIVSDEPYKKIIYDGLKYPSPLNFHRHSIICHLALQRPVHPRRAHRLRRPAPGLRATTTI